MYGYPTLKSTLCSNRAKNFVIMALAKTTFEAQIAGTIHARISIHLMNVHYTNVQQLNTIFF